MNDTPNFEFVREQTVGKIEELLKERQEIERKILALKQTLRGLDGYLQKENSPLRLDPFPLPAGLEGLRDMGLTDAVRKILQTALEPISARQIRDRLRSVEYPKLPKNNPMAAIHGVLTRLRKNDELRIITGPDGKPVFGWLDPQDPANVFRRSIYKAVAPILGGSDR